MRILCPNAVCVALDMLDRPHQVSGDANDSQFCDFLEANYLNEQVESIKEISDHVTNLRRVGIGLGEYLFDKQTLGGGEQVCAA